MPPPAPEQENARTITDYISLVDKRDERNQFIRWLDNRQGKSINIDEFTSEHLDDYEKKAIYTEWQNDLEIAGLIDNYAKVMSNGNIDE